MLLLNARHLWPFISTTAVLTAVAESLTSPVVAMGKECTTEGAALQVTTGCVDPKYRTAIIDGEMDDTVPIPHHKVSGHFDGTSIDFNIYFPKSGWDSRFFQMVYPLQNSTADDHEIGFGAESGGYTNRVAGGGGYRADAAVAKVSRILAAEYYNKSDTKIYGYIYGASGGSFVTVGAIENTFDIWQGAIPMVQAVPISNPNNFCTRAMAGLVLDAQKDKIIDSVRPGGDMNPLPHLDQMRREVLTEVTKLGIPLTAFEDWAGIVQNRTSFLRTFRSLGPPMIASFDPTYFSDFWTEKGYLGAEKSTLGDFYRNSIYEFDGTVQRVQVGTGDIPISIILDKVPSKPPGFGLQFTIQSKSRKSTLGVFTAQLDKRTRTAIVDPDQDSAVLALLTKGTSLRVSNRSWLAASVYHRHQVPTRAGFYGYDYLRKSDGQPKYPQRSVLIANTISRGATGGSSFTGNITGKVMVLGTLKDFDAMPWHADWYKGVVRKALGNRLDDNFRLYYLENADHYLEPVPEDQSTRIISYHPAYEQHLRDLSAWVEKGKSPPRGTSYTVTDGQVRLPDSAAQRNGIQSVVHLTVRGQSRITVKAGQPVYFNAHIEVPSNTGSVTSIEWDFEGTGDFVKRRVKKARVVMDVTTSRLYQRKGTYYVAVRVASNREGDAKTPYAQVSNLGRIRLIVE